MLKKYFTVVVVGLLFFNVTFAQSDTSSVQDLLNTIKQLQAQMQSLQTQIVDLKTEVQSLKIELKFSRVLAQGTTGDDVKQLQEFLKTFTGAYPNGAITGYYGPLTEKAVKRFQAQNGIESVGIVGPKTQEKINVLAAAIPAVSATPVILPTISDGQAVTTQIAPAISNEATGTPTVSAVPCRRSSNIQTQPASSAIKIMSPNGGEQWQVGGTYTIKYSAKDVLGNKALLIYLEKGYDMPTTKTGANSSLLIGVTTNMESYTYTVPPNTQSFPGLGSNYKITIMVEGSVAYCNGIFYIGDSSDAEFSIVAGQNNIPVAVPTPTISVPIIIAPVNGGGYGKENISLSLTNQIVALQEKLHNSTDDETRTILTTQINELKRQLQTLEDKKTAVLKQIMALQNQLYYATDATARASLETQITALGGQVQTLSTPTSQDQINALLDKINAYQDKLNKNTDTSERDSLTAQITAFKAQLQILQSNPTTPTVQPAIPTFSGSTSEPTKIESTSVLTSANKDKIDIFYTQITGLQNQLNSTLNAATRDSLIAQVIALKAQVQALQINSATISATQSMTTSGGGYIQLAQDKPTDTQVPENTVSTSIAQTSKATPITQYQAIKVLSPNGGETLTIGKTYEIKWNGGNNSVDLYLIDSPTLLGKKIFSGITNSNYVSWAATPLLPSDISSSANNSYATPSGQYKILINCTDGNCAVDFSDSYFKIIE